LHPFLLKLYADGGYHGPVFQSTVRKILRQIDVETVKGSDLAKGFAISPKRWIVERTTCDSTAARRLAKDWECRNRGPCSYASCSESSVRKHHDPGYSAIHCLQSASC
jgi:transposase